MCACVCVSGYGRLRHTRGSLAGSAAAQLTAPQLPPPQQQERTRPGSAAPEPALSPAPHQHSSSQKVGRHGPTSPHSRPTSCSRPLPRRRRRQRPRQAGRRDTQVQGARQSPLPLRSCPAGNGRAGRIGCSMLQHGMWPGCAAGCPVRPASCSADCRVDSSPSSLTCSPHIAGLACRVSGCCRAASSRGAKGTGAVVLAGWSRVLLPVASCCCAFDAVAHLRLALASSRSTHSPGARCKPATTSLLGHERARQSYSLTATAGWCMHAFAPLKRSFVEKRQK